MNPFAQSRLGALVVGLALIVAGVAILGPPLVERLLAIEQTSQRGNSDSAALQAWKAGGSGSLTGAVTDSGAKATCAPGGNPADFFALVQFSGVVGYDYAGVAGDGTWDMLHNRSMVHYAGTPGPGQRGNVIIAFHREPGYEHIDQLVPGGSVTIEDRSCHVYVYTVDNRWTLDPDKVTQLNPTNGHDLTLITCTPFWVDNQRYVWRAHLTSVDGKTA